MFGRKSVTLVHMKYTPLPAHCYQANRSRFGQAMQPKSLAIFNSNDLYPISADSTLPFAQHTDMLYLTGVHQEETILLIFPDAADTTQREILFLRETNEHIAVWEGAKLTQDQARERTGIQTIHWVDDFERIFFELAAQCDTFYFNKNEHYRAAVETQTREDRFIEWAKKNYPAHQTARSNPILQQLRAIKSKEEIQQIAHACTITEKGFRRILPFVKPGVWEFEIEAEFSHEFLRQRADGFAYQPIIAGGKNSNVLHYLENSRQCQEGDLLLMDVGASYGYYHSDMTRTIPVSGRFTARQRAVYEAVLRVKKEATQALRPGVLWKEFHVEVGKLMTRELLSLGLLSKVDIQNEDPKRPAYKKYFMHGTSHHLGLDTHDYGLLHLPMEANMVFTVEPGIYIPEEGFGVRLEDNVVIQNDGEPINLMAGIPVEPDAIETLMNS